MRDNLTHTDFIKDVQEQLIGFINKQILDLEGELYYDGHTIYSVGPTRVSTIFSPRYFNRHL